MIIGNMMQSDEKVVNFGVISKKTKIIYRSLSARKYILVKLNINFLILVFSIYNFNYYI